MKRFVNLCLVILAAVMVYSAFDTIIETRAAAPVVVPAPLPAQPYLAQSLPGAEPQVFAYGVLNGELHSAPVFTPELTSVYWCAADGNSAFTNTMRVVGGNWTELKRLVPADGLDAACAPFISPDGSRLFFLSAAPIPGSTAPQKENIWVAERIADAWGEPHPLPAVINNLRIHWSFSTASNGDLYFAAGEAGINDLYVSRFVDGEYAIPQKLGAPVNSEDQYELTPAIAPDGSYMVFSRLPKLQGHPRLYITYAQPDGSWSQPALIRNIKYGFAPALSPGGEYLFFISDQSSISWRDTSFVDLLRPKVKPHNDPFRIKTEQIPLTKILPKRGMIFIKS
jgi:hypothetical protein